MTGCYFRWTVESMEKARTEYRGALMWMKNVSTELDPDTFKQLEKFRKVQGHVKASKQRFDKLKLDSVQKIDLLAASRCNMFSHALIMYQNTLVTFWDKTSKTMNHVNNGFKGYQYYEFNYIKDLAAPSKKLASDETKPDKEKTTAASFPEEATNDLVNLTSESNDTTNNDAESKKTDSLHNLLDLNLDPSEPVPLLDDDDEILLNIDTELDQLGGQLAAGGPLGGDTSSLLQGPGCGAEGGPWPGHDSQESEQLLDELLASAGEGEVGGFTAEWDSVFSSASRQQGGDLLGPAGGAEKRQSLTDQTFLPSQLFHNLGLQSSSHQPPTLSSPAPAAAAQASQNKGRFRLSLFLATGEKIASYMDKMFSGASKGGDMSEWFSLFADLDPLANPDTVGKGPAQYEGGC